MIRDARYAMRDMRCGICDIDRESKSRKVTESQRQEAQSKGRNMKSLISLRFGTLNFTSKSQIWAKFVGVRR